ncbi:hypothetical protein [Actinoplanes sp. NPDC051859]|uniref:hypothetical protein n=1 Tax=Actinoplanes sp. NPDC051859 TaxID=3363909 RepID=UPI0037893FF2
MRKWIYAGAMASCLLLGAAPAYADETAPAPVGDLTGGLLSTADDAKSGLGLDPAGGGLGLANPLGGSDVLNVKPGTNSADLNGVSTLPRVPSTATSSAAVVPQTAEDSPIGGLPTGALGGLLPQTGGGLPLLGSLPLVGGLRGRTAATESEPFVGGIPLLGGLGGLLPVNDAPIRTLPADTGLPPGGSDVTPSALDDTTSPDQAKDSRVHEEPVDGEERDFTSGSRPIAGEDTDF